MRRSKADVGLGFVGRIFLEAILHGTSVVRVLPTPSGSLCKKVAPQWHSNPRRLSNEAVNCACHIVFGQLTTIARNHADFRILPSITLTYYIRLMLGNACISEPSELGSLANGTIPVDCSGCGIRRTYDGLGCAWYDLKVGSLTS